MQIITPNTNQWEELVSKTLKAGGIVLHPTDTAYGLAADATNVNAIQKLNQLKKRNDTPYIIVIRDIPQAKKYVEINDLAESLITRFFPGALSLLVRKKNSLPDILTVGKPKVAIRQPDHFVIQAISDTYEAPYTSTSANIHQGETPYSVGNALTQLDSSLIDIVIDTGPLPHRPTSTIIDTTTNPLTVIREGAISIEQIQNFHK